ncbi:T6SS immunity protein Tli4 family protein [Acerihabitans arboris]|uniref:Tle cognate immunity protein 4 C-terminal domain-containing protein n=1 Tax=Acerihabitans arboris TaxID=2691583 RepID=A0A845SNT3_9GAMM|nr:T6SS immunity protein Tli4 family protein [Acerihabitans arboris]NDL64188.1 hypothetical protein [Acerihabitans arboris]
MRLKDLLALIGIVSIAGIVCWFLYRNTSVQPLTAEEKNMIDFLFTKTKAQCVGRYIFEVPDSFINTRHDSAKINEMRITSKRISRPAFEQRIRLREQELAKGHTVRVIDQPFLKQVYRLKDNAIIFDRNENESVPGFGRILEGHLFSNDVAFIMHSEITDYSDERFTKERDFFLRDEANPATANTKPQNLAEMHDLISRLSGREDDSIPVQPGTCIPDGFIADGKGKGKEDSTLFFQQSGIIIYAKTNNYLKRNESLLDWGRRDIEPVLNKLHSHTLHKGKVSLPDMDAEEWLIKGKQEVRGNIVDGYRFIFNANETIADYHHPLLSVQLHNASLVSDTYNTAQLVDIWERITRTFRLRPNAF